MACLIESLNLDVQVNILSHIPNVETLVSLLKATPRLYQAFSSARNRILTKVMMNTYGPELYADALAAAKVVMLPLRILSRTEMLSFLSDYTHIRRLTEFPENDLPTSIIMCQLHWALNYHAKRFSKHAIEFIASCTKGFCGEEVYFDLLQAYINSALSSTEQVRLRRAFLRFQIFNRLFCNAEPSEDGELSQFTGRMPPWEAEEIASVCVYLVRDIHQTFDLAEEDFLSACTTEVGLANTFGGTVGGVFDIREENFEAGDSLYRARLKAHMLASGLCSLSRLFKSTGQARLALLSVKDDFRHFLKPPSINPLLHYALEAVPTNTNNNQDPSSSSGSLQRVSQHIRAESSQQSTLTWQWAHARNASGDRRSNIYYELRGWGYVFWDLRRMRYTGILRQRYVIWWDD